MNTWSIPRLVLAGTGSGVGKTTTTVAIARALQRLGLKVALFKCGPDYLDPTYHARALGRASHTLDGWMMGKEAVVATFVRQSQGCDVALIEGVMGLHDGASPHSDEGSTAQIAKWLQAPVVALVDASGMARTLAAIAQGLAAFDPLVDFRGVIANFVGSRGHLDLLQHACKHHPCWGGFIRGAGPTFPERHLGLHTASRETIGDQVFEEWASAAQTWIDLPALLACARQAPALSAAVSDSCDQQQAHAVRLGVARDEAFHFYYDHNLRLLQAAGAHLIEFSPLHDQALPELDGLYLGGGYPEVHAATLAANHSMRASVRAFAAAGKPIYAECGGLMALCDEILTVHGESFKMWGVLPGRVTMHASLQALGYVEVTTTTDTFLGGEGTSFRGHQFRYSTFEGPATVEHGQAKVYRLITRRNGSCVHEGYRIGPNVLASYVHAHWASNPAIASAFVQACRR